MLRDKRERPLQMARSISTWYSNPDFTCHGMLLPILLLLLLLLLQISSQLANCGTIVKFLPGFRGPLPFVLETGYVGVGEKDGVQAFYYFIESENNPKEDPLVLWLTGGPGCSGFSGLVFEIGPLAFVKEEYNGSLPKLVLRPHSWTKVSSIIFVDLPVSTGFSYVRTESATQRSDWSLAHHAHEFLRKWLVDHPEFLSNEVYIAGDSYSGLIVPVVVQEISQENEKGVQPSINLQGYLLGNPITSRMEDNYAIPFVHGMALISDELYEGSIGKWQRCTWDIPQKMDIPNSFEYHVNLSRKGYRSLIYSGDHDMEVPFLATQAWIRSLNYSIVDDWRQWYTNGQIAGYMRIYSNRMTFATVKGGGNTAPEYKPAECFAMFSRWISNKAL